MNIFLVAAVLLSFGAYVSTFLQSFDPAWDRLEAEMKVIKASIRKLRYARKWISAQHGTTGRHHIGTGKHAGWTIAKINAVADTNITPWAVNQRHREPVRGIRFAKVITA